MRRVVLDTCVIAAAFRSRRGASFALLALVAEARLVPLAGPSLFLEYDAVPKRAEQRAVSGLTLAEIDAALAALAAAVEAVPIHFQWRPQLPDPGDEMVLEVAVNGRADALVTHNRGHFVAGAARFGVALLSPGALLERIRQ